MGLLSSIFLSFIPSPAYATDLEQAVVVALGTANTEITQSETASAAVAPLVTIATEQANQAIQAATSLSNQVTNATSAVGQVDAAIVTVTNATGIDQSSLTIIEAKDTVVNAQTAINAISSVIAQSELVEATTARTNVTNAMNTAATEFSQANQSISNAQDAINNLQATIATVRDVLQNIDDAGIQMILPFNMRMGNTVYNAIYVGSNATLTFGVNEGANYYSTPNAPSVSVGGYDWTTWSYGTGITYATTAGTLDIAWDVRVFPTTDASIQLTQLRFNADVNPSTGAWTATVSGIGPHVDNARWNYRESTGGTIIPIVDNDTQGANEFQGSLSQGSYTVPTNLPDNSGVQAVVDSANAQLAALNQRISAVVIVNSQNQQLVNTIPSTISVQTTITNANTAKINLQSSLNQKSTTLTNTINTNIPTPAPVISQTEVVNGEIVVNVLMPSGYQGNTWFYQVITDDPNAENPYAGQTLNTDGAPGSFTISGLTEGATYTIRVANWSGPTSTYSSTEVFIPSSQTSNLTGGGSIDFNSDGQTPQEPSNPGTGSDTTDPDLPVGPGDDGNPGDGGSSGDDGSQGTDTDGSDNSSSNDGQNDSPSENQNTDNSQDNDTLSADEIQDTVSDLIEDGNITASDAETILEVLSADGEITNEEVANLSEVLAEDGSLTLAEKDLLSKALVQAADGAPVEASAIAAAGLEYRDLPPKIPVEVREDMNGNPVVITAEVASALLTLENPAAFIGGITACINPDEAIEGLTEEQKCEILKALANIGADMSPQERQKAKEVLVAAVLVGQVIVGSALIRRN